VLAVTRKIEAVETVTGRVLTFGMAVEDNRFAVLNELPVCGKM
jgi:hypothetical protein